jgi:hypothetical protein
LLNFFYRVFYRYRFLLVVLYWNNFAIKCHVIDIQRRGVIIGWGSLYFIFDPKWSKIGTDIHKRPRKTKEEKIQHFLAILSVIDERGLLIDYYAFRCKGTSIDQQSLLGLHTQTALI